MMENAWAANEAGHKTRDIQTATRRKQRDCFINTWSVAGFIAERCWRSMVGVYGTPLQDRGRLFSEDVDQDDPWQFKNFRVT